MKKTVRDRGILEIFILAALAWLLVSSNHWLSFIDDETTIINDSLMPVHQMIATFWSGAGLHEHPPLFEFIYHFWLRASGGAFEWLRVPSILFYLVGLWLLARIGMKLGGEEAGRIVLWLGALWPYGFHYGRLAAWYSLSFMCLAGLTLAYLRLRERASAPRWLAFIAISAALVWTNYFGWAFLACVAFDYCWRERENISSAAMRVATAAAVLAAIYIPLWRAFFHELGAGEIFTHSFAGRILNGGYSMYVLMVSESVAPWFKEWGIPAAICVLCCIAITAWFAPAESRRFLLFALLLLGIMAFAGIANAKRLLPLAVWILAPIGVALAKMSRGIPRKILAASLAGILFAGWAGIYLRTHYAAPRFLEPWGDISETAANRVRFNWNVVSNSEVFFFYLTYALHSPQVDGHWNYHGTLTFGVTDPHVFDAGDWIEAGYPVTPEVYFVRGAPGPLEAPPGWDAEQWLHSHCATEYEDLRIADPAASLKARYIPEAGGMPWRIRAFEFACPVATLAPDVPH
jgi:Dolichyl-phosphate-mannose-protein mannosyltransferase